MAASIPFKERFSKMNEIIYSHRPKSGVSVAAISNGSQLFFAVSLVNDGTSRKHLFHKERCDAFSRSVARSILNGRLTLLQAGEPTNGVVFDTELNARLFMANFRKIFKPTVDESDDFLCAVGSFGGVEVRSRLDAEAIYERIMNTANEVVADAKTTV